MTATAPLFQLGQTVATPGALSAAEQHNVNIHALIHCRHARGDFGDLSHEDVEANLNAMADGAREVEPRVGYELRRPGSRPDRNGLFRNGH